MNKFNCAATYLQLQQIKTAANDVLKSQRTYVENMYSGNVLIGVHLSILVRSNIDKNEDDHSPQDHI
jgi:hypothetical protein